MQLMHDLYQIAFFCREDETSVSERYEACRLQLDDSLLAIAYAQGTLCIFMHPYAMYLSVSEHVWRTTVCAC
jgi:hypothetical protein